MPETGVAVDEEGVVGTAGRFRHGLGGGVRQAVRRCGDEGLEGEFRVELDRRRFPACPGRPEPGCGWGSGRQAEDLLGGRLDGERCRLVLLHLEAAPDGCTDLVGQGVLNHGQVARLHPLPDEPVGDRQDELTVGEGHGLYSREPQLPGALGHLVAQGPGAPCPKISCLGHCEFRTPLLPPRRPASMFGTILGMGNLMNVHRARPVRLEAIGKSRLTWADSPPAAGIDSKAEAWNLRRIGSGLPYGRCERLN